MSQSDDNDDLEAQIKEALARRRPAPPPPAPPRIVLNPGPVTGQPTPPQPPSGTPAPRSGGMVADPETRLSQPVRQVAPSPRAAAAAPMAPTARPVDDDAEPAIPPPPGQQLGRIELEKKLASAPAKPPVHPFFAGRRHLWPLLVLPIVSIGAVLLLFWFMNYELGGQGVGDLAPLVEADPTPIKVQPVEEGGMEIPDQDREIFNTLDESSESQEALEQLVPPPEEPVVPEAPEPATAAAEPGAITVDENGLPVVAAPDPAAPAATADAATDVPTDDETAAVAAALTAAAARAAAEPAADAAAEPAADVAAEPEAVETASLPAGSYRVQLAAVRSEADARTTWAQLQQKLPELLGDLSLFIERIDLGADKGIFYRVQAVPLADHQTAQKLCGNLAARGQDCLVVRP
ncbi:MAG: SPOR domain-containing protein [Rhodospirillaceae bacterium]|nr:SPOR domain-containing protein [Rhodospirillaceae bacterium]